MKTTGIITVVWGVLLIIGGVMGGLKAGSQVSLIAGAVSGLLAIGAGGLCLRGRRVGVGMASGLATALAIFGFGTWLGMGKDFMPRGVIGILSLLEILALLPALKAPVEAPADDQSGHSAPS